MHVLIPLDDEDADMPISHTSVQTTGSHIDAQGLVHGVVHGPQVCVVLVCMHALSLTYWIPDTEHDTLYLRWYHRVSGQVIS